MGTAERHRESGAGAAELTDAEAEFGGGADGAAVSGGDEAVASGAGDTVVFSADEAAAVGADGPVSASRTAEAGAQEYEYSARRPPLWVEEPARRRRLPDPVRTAAVRAVIIVAVTLVQAMVAVLAALAGSWLSFPMVLSSVASTVVATWGVLDVWVTRQVWNQRHGVVSMPSSTARRLRRERRRARRQARAAERGKGRIRGREGIQGRGGSGQLSHS
ncbi:hypothetical protein [Streptomyces sp. NPDC029674]|uniref:hypothetical protein n=1 Tax=Streptomyces sp. NPDC029674 TaxID=3365297 RepID=UPI00385055CC